MNAVALSGGGIKGAEQLGPIYYLWEKGVKFGKIVGTSVGALNGVMWAQGDVPLLKDLYFSLKTKWDLVDSWLWVFGRYWPLKLFTFPVDLMIGFFKEGL